MRSDKQQNPTGGRLDAERRPFAARRERPWWTGLVIAIGGLAAAGLGMAAIWFTNVYLSVFIAGV